MVNFKLRVGAEFKRLREELDLTQLEVANCIGVTQACICQIEKGSRCNNIASLLSLAIVLDVELWQVFKQATLWK